MDSSISRPLQYDTTLTPATSLYVFSNLLHVAATAISFFLVYYFVTTLQFSLVQAGLLMSFYGVGIFCALIIKPTVKKPKMILGALLLSTLTLGNFLIFTAFVPLAFNLVLFGFADALFKAAPLPSSQKLYHSSNLGLGLAMLAITLFSLNDFKVLCISALILNALALFFLSGHLKQSKLTPKALQDAKNDGSSPQRKCMSSSKQDLCHPRPQVGDPVSNRVLYWTPDLQSRMTWFFLFFLGGILLAQLTTTYGLYLALTFPRLGLSTLAIFMLVHLSILCFLQKPLLMVFYRGETLFRGGCGALLLGLGCYVLNFGHLFSVIVLSAMVFSLGEIFFISALYQACRQTGFLNAFSKTVALSFIVGSSLGVYVYQYFGANTLWQACAIIGVLCFGLGFKGLKATTTLSPSP